MVRQVHVINDASGLTPEKFTSLFLYGANETPQGLYDRVKGAEYEGVDVNIDADVFFDSVGRFANPSRVNLVQRFFELNPLAPSEFFLDLEPGVYSARDVVGFRYPNYTVAQVDSYLADAADFNFQHFFFDDGDDANYSGFQNRGERAYVFGNSGFEMNLDQVEFVVLANGERELRNVKVEADQDNFDFVGGPLSNLFNAYAEPRIDPYKVGDQVLINIVGDMAPYTYSYSDFRADEKQFDATGAALAGYSEVVWKAQTNELIDRMKSNGTLDYYSDGFNIVYGDGDANIFNEFIAEIKIELGDLGNKSAPLLVLGGGGGDDISGTEGGDRLYGHEGHDRLLGNAGNDLLFGGSGSDWIEGGVGDDLLYGELSDENYRGSEESSFGLIAGDDVLFGGDGDDFLDGAEGNDLLFGEAGNDALDGGDGADLLSGGDGVNFLTGGDGADLFLVGKGVNVILDASIDDTVGFSTTLIDAALALASYKADPSYLYDDDAELSLGPATLIEGLGGLDEIMPLAGGFGSSQTGQYWYESSYYDDVSASIEGTFAPHFTDYGVTVSYGGGVYDFYFPYYGSSYKYASGGEEIGDYVLSASDLIVDYWYYGSGLLNFYQVIMKDFQNGDGGIYLIDDSEFLASNPNAISDASLINNNGNYLNLPATDEEARKTDSPVTPGTGDDEIVGTDGDDNLDGGAGNDLIVGLEGSDVISGGDADDIIYGGDGDDTLNGDDGNDFFVGGAGADDLDGGNGNDTASYSTATSGVYIHMGDTAQNTGDAAGDSYTSIEIVEGSAFADTLIGGVTIHGGAGDDTIYGNSSAGQQLNGGDGNDVIHSNSGADTVSGGAGDDTVISYGGDDIITLGDGDDYSAAGDGNDTIDGGAGEDELRGGAGNDTILGGSGNDSLHGGDGDDLIDFGTGDDYATGGLGADTFIFKAGYGSDEIGGFESGAGVGDVIQLESSLVADYATLLTYINDWGGPHTFIDFGNGDVITLWSTTIADLHADDFTFVGGNPPVNTAPLAVADNGFSTDVDVAVTITATALLANDTDVDGDTLTIQSVQSAVNGSVALDINGDVVFTPSAGYSGTASFTYTVTDGNGGTSTAQVDLTVETATPAPIVIEQRIASSADDVEEDASGTVYLDSSDIELVDDTTFSGADQTVGLRFTSLGIPQGAIITSAWLQFQVDEVDSGTTSLEIRAQDADDAGAFTATNNDVSSRTTTSALVSWQPFAWTVVGEAGVEQRTPDLMAIVQEIVDRQGWAPNNDIAFVITGSGERTAVSFDSDAGAAPLLHIEYQLPPAADSATSGADTLNGTASADVIDGLAGNDVISGGAGDDVLIGGAGADQLDGGTGVDTASYSTAAAGVTVHMGNTTQNTGDALGDSYTSIEVLEGSTFGDTLIAGVTVDGGGGDDTIYGYSSSGQQLSGGQGNDVIHANGGADTLDGGSGDDTIVAYGGDDLITLGDGDDYTAAGDGNDTIDGGNGADEIRAGAGNDTLMGGNGNDSLHGDDGDDTIDFGLGDDYANGGAGADTFIFKAGYGADTITDFEGGAGVGDVVEFQGSPASDYAALQSYMNDWGGPNTFIDFGNGDSVTLYDTTMADLHADDFRFVA